MTGNSRPGRISKHDKIRAGNTGKLGIYCLGTLSLTWDRRDAETPIGRVRGLIVKSEGYLTTSPKSWLLDVPRFILWTAD